jgi:hypothetical protein
MPKSTTFDTNCAWAWFQPPMMPKSNAYATLFHEGWNDGVERALVRRERIRLAGRQAETRPTIVQRKAGMRRDKSRAEGR